jgi:2-polyprenyl-3-methyl-5-hydroxy-6-metoxy-1,4-benzoquinol methylase
VSIGEAELHSIAVALKGCRRVLDCSIETIDDGGEPYLVAYVKLSRANLDRSESDEALTSLWQRLYEGVYERQGGETPVELRRRVYRTAVENVALPDAQVDDLFSHRAARLAAMAPRRILDIGCGTGEFLNALKGSCEHYCGTDISANALKVVRERSAAYERVGVDLQVKEANDFAGLGGSYDLVILNSIVQHFPDEKYLRDVLTKALDACGPSGSVFIGDVRNSWLQAAFHRDVLQAQRERKARARSLPEREAVLARIDREPELLAAPQYFWALARDNSAVRAVSMSPAAGGYDNEFTRYRYDVLIRAGAPAAGRRANVTPCEEPAKLGEALKALAAQRSDGVMLAGIRSHRVASHCEAALRLFGREAPAGRDPAFSSVDRMPGVTAEESWIRCNEFGDRDVLVRRAGESEIPHSEWYDAETIAASMPASLVVEPLESLARREAVRAIRAELSASLPKQLVPDAIHVVESIPAPAAKWVDFTSMRPSLRASR